MSLKVRGNLIIDLTHGEIVPVQHIRGISLYGPKVILEKSGTSHSTTMEAPGKNQDEILDNIASAYLQAFCNYNEMVSGKHEEEAS